MDESLLTKMEEAFTHFPLRKHLLFVAEVGSAAYGLRLEDSGDRDIFAVVLPPPEFELGIQTWEECQPTLGEFDFKFYSLRKFMALLAKGNPNVLETLWVSPLHITPTIAPILSERMMFSTQQAAKAMAGYASSQLARMESPAGFDPKMASHALRVLRMGLAFSLTGVLKVRRTDDAWELKAVKRGEWPASRVREEAEQLFEKFNAARNSAILPERVDLKQVTNQLLSATFYGWRQLDDPCSNGL